MKIIQTSICCLSLLLLLSTACASVNKQSVETSNEGPNVIPKSNETIGMGSSSTTASKQDLFPEFVENNFHPIVVNGELLGGFTRQEAVSPKEFKANCGGKLVEYDDFCCDQISDNPDVFVTPDCDLLIDLVRGGETFKLYDFYVKRDDHVGLIPNVGHVETGIGEVTNYSMEGAGNDFYYVKINRQSPQSEEKKLRMTVSINGNWDAQPRPIESMGTDLFSVDINGDGVREKLKVSKSITIFEPQIPVTVPRFEGLVKITIERNETEFLVSETELDGIYARTYAFVLLDVNNDSNYELVEVTEGHDSFIGISRILMNNESISSELLLEHQVVR